MQTKTITQETIKEMLQTSNKAVERALVSLYDRQTMDEQTDGTTKHVNARGFSGADAYILSSFAEQINKKVGQPDSFLGRKREYGECLSPKQMALARQKVVKYARQLFEIAQEKGNVPAVVKVEVVKLEPAQALSFHLMIPKQGWQEITEEQAKAWYDRMYKMAVFYRQEECVLAWEKKAPGKFWINHAGELLQVLGIGETPEPVKGEKETVDAGIAAAMTVKRMMDTSWTVAADRAFDAWRDGVETLDEPEEIKAEREDAMRPEEPYSKFASIKAGIKAWAAE